VEEFVDSAITRVPVVRVVGGAATAAIDAIATEEPLELRLSGGDGGGHLSEPVSITMRTPGRDLELAVGFLVGEGVVRQRSDVSRVGHVGAPARPDGTSNVVEVLLGEKARFDRARLTRHFYATSSCGVCGKASVDALRTHAPLLSGGDVVPLLPEALHLLPMALRAHQRAFGETGGLHAAAVFRASPVGSDLGRSLPLVREDVGRHNAVDKVVGALALAGELPASSAILLVSGRASFELVQKAWMAGVPFLLAVGAPSTLAVELAREAGMTLVGFLRDGRFNIYAGAERIQTSAVPSQSSRPAAGNA
jgi:FdhD protein